MSFDVKLLADSISAENKRIRTFQLRYPRFIHAELMTHRVFSRNASSSRAIPVKRMIEDILADPAMPIHWGANQPGMQAHHELTEPYKSGAEKFWLRARDEAVNQAENLNTLGAHKQIINRILEPYMHINVVLSGTEFANWYALRNHEDAQPEIRHLAKMMFMAQECRVAKLLHPGEWHLPYIEAEDWKLATEFCKLTNLNPSHTEILNICIKVSVARCARVSYKLHDGSNSSIEKDVELHNKLVVAIPLHASPAEHQATPDVMTEGHLGPYGEWRVGNWMNSHQHGNLKGWRQYRQQLKNQYIPG